MRVDTPSDATDSGDAVERGTRVVQCEAHRGRACVSRSLSTYLVSCRTRCRYGFVTCSSSGVRTRDHNVPSPFSNHLPIYLYNPFAQRA